jgi:hypothetical protein
LILSPAVAAQDDSVSGALGDRAGRLRLDVALQIELKLRTYVALVPRAGRGEVIAVGTLGWAEALALTLALSQRARGSRWVVDIAAWSRLMPDCLIA